MKTGCPSNSLAVITGKSFVMKNSKEIINELLYPILTKIFSKHAGVV